MRTCRCTYSNKNHLKINDTKQTKSIKKTDKNYLDPKLFDHKGLMGIASKIHGGL
jgi:hypothetical protein